MTDGALERMALGARQCFGVALEKQETPSSESLKPAGLFHHSIRFTNRRTGLLPLSSKLGDLHSPLPVA